MSVLGLESSVFIGVNQNAISPPRRRAGSLDDCQFPEGKKVSRKAKIMHLLNSWLSEDQTPFYKDTFQELLSFLEIAIHIMSPEGQSILIVPAVIYADRYVSRVHKLKVHQVVRHS
jgi:hypothetical protein